MPSPFPGMDPYLEHPSRWSEVHSRLISSIANGLERRLSDAYFISVEKRVYQLTSDDAVLIGIPDTTLATFSRVANTSPQDDGIASEATVTLKPAAAYLANYLTVTLPIPMEVRESYLEVRDIETGDVITAIEILSPVNKRSGEGRRVYELKRQAILGSQTHFIELDLLRAGSPMAMQGSQAATDYRLLVSRASTRPRAQLYGFNVEQPIPIIPVPLRPGEPDLDLDLKGFLHEIYAQARYARRIDYQQSPVPPLPEVSQAWAIDRIHSASRPE
jgi:Protein of unknown function (DUF4058)